MRPVCCKQHALVDIANTEKVLFIRSSFHRLHFEDPRVEVQEPDKGDALKRVERTGFYFEQALLFLENWSWMGRDYLVGPRCAGSIRPHGSQIRIARALD